MGLRRADVLLNKRVLLGKGRYSAQGKKHV